MITVFLLFFFLVFFFLFLFARGYVVVNRMMEEGRARGARTAC
jgi:hypothetical protein